VSDAVLWIHDEMLGQQHPAFDEAGDVPRCFVFDTRWLADERLSLKRIVFMYESALDMEPRPVIIKGEVEQAVGGFAQQHGAGRIITGRSYKPRIKRQIEHLGERFEVQVVEAVPLVRVPVDADLKRFSRYWNQAKRTAFDRSE